MNNINDNTIIIEQTRKYIQKLRKNSSFLNETDFKIALGKVIIDIKDAKKNDTTIMKKLFSYE